MLNKYFSVAALSLCVVASIGAQHAAAQSCPNKVKFGMHRPSVRATGETRRVQLTGVYFRTSDRNAFIPERPDRTYSPSVLRMKSVDFLAKLEQLKQQNAATISSELMGQLFLGDTGELNLEHEAANVLRDSGDLGSVLPEPSRWLNLDRQTTVSVSLDAGGGETFYRVTLLSSFVEVRPDVTKVTVDVDAGLLLDASETVVLKFMGDKEVARFGSEGTYLAVSVRPVDDN